MNFETLLLTIVLEFVVYIFFIKEPLQKILLYAVIINVITQPIAQFLFMKYFTSPLYVSYGFYTAFLVIEAFVIISEMYLISYLTTLERRPAFRLSLLANFISAFSGLIIYMLL